MTHFYAKSLKRAEKNFNIKACGISMLPKASPMSFCRCTKESQAGFGQLAMLRYKYCIVLASLLNTFSRRYASTSYLATEFCSTAPK